MSKKVAILVDGDFFIRCYKSHLKKQPEDLNPKKISTPYSYLLPKAYQ
ncbi:hypothetical protein HP2RS_04277 [Helicobacter pylori]|nr:hypothetical protein HP2RS_04277 [Helicobacter pylori]OUC11429.1 hypothetical protein X568_00055 [Helicobacter pylori SS1]